MTHWKENLKLMLGLPEEAKIKGIIYRKVKRNSQKKYPAVVYELKGSQHIKHINKKLSEELGLDTVSNIYGRKQLEELTPNELKEIPTIVILLSTFLEILREKGLWDGKI